MQSRVYRRNPLWYTLYGPPGSGKTIGSKIFTVDIKNQKSANIFVLGSDLMKEDELIKAATSPGKHYYWVQRTYIESYQRQLKSIPSRPAENTVVIETTSPDQILCYSTALFDETHIPDDGLAELKEKLALLKREREEKMVHYPQNLIFHLDLPETIYWENIKKTKQHMKLYQLGKKQTKFLKTLYKRANDYLRVLMWAYSGKIIRIQCAAGSELALCVKAVDNSFDDVPQPKVSVYKHEQPKVDREVDEIEDSGELVIDIDASTSGAMRKSSGRKPNASRGGYRNPEEPHPKMRRMDTTLIHDPNV